MGRSSSDTRRRRSPLDVRRRQKVWQWKGCRRARRRRCRGRRRKWCWKRCRQRSQKFATIGCSKTPVVGRRASGRRNRFGNGGGFDEDVGNGVGPAVGEFPVMVWATASANQQSAVSRRRMLEDASSHRWTSGVGSRFGNGILKVTSDLREQTRTQLTGHLATQMEGYRQLRTDSSPAGPRTMSSPPLAALPVVVVVRLRNAGRTAQNGEVSSGVMNKVKAAQRKGRQERQA